jgi:hypothetical protein
MDGYAPGHGSCLIYLIARHAGIMHVLQTCVKAVDAAFPMATGRFYVEAVPNAEGMRARATGMVRAAQHHSTA